MKKFLLLALGAMLSAGAVSADAKVSFPGFAKEKSQKERVIKKQHKTFGANKLRPVKAPAKMAIDPNDMIDKSMLTSYKKTTTYAED